MLKQSLLLATALGMLSGCVGVVAAGAGSAATAMIYDKRNMKTLLQDQTIIQKGSTAIEEHPGLKGTRVNVSAINHRVLLTGQVKTKAQRLKAGQLVRKVPRVKGIVNALAIGPVISPAIQSQDALITTRLKTNLLAEPQFQSVPVKIITENKVIYLMGLVSKHEAKIAIRVAQKTRGGRRVVNLFEIVKK